jgi:cation transport ATPase
MDNSTYDQGQPQMEPMPDSPVMPPEPPKKSNRTMWIIIGVVVVVLCCCCVVGVAGYYAYTSGVFSNMMQ